MKKERNILVAFLLNLSFAAFELVGGFFTGSVAILSDAVHDAGDALSIGISYALERKSRRQPDSSYTYGYGRYSVLGGAITTAVLLVGSGMVIIGAIQRLFDPQPIRYDRMILFALIGAVVNTVAAYVTREGDSLNQKAVNLHMLEDVLGWVVVLLGAVLMRFTDWWVLDPLLSIGVAGYILYHAAKNFKTIGDVLLEKAPKGISGAALIERLLAIDGVENIHHLHLWSVDGQTVYATLHAVTDNTSEVKAAVRAVLKEQGIAHVTVEWEDEATDCQDIHCHIEAHHHHHHNHH